ncbi:MAG TPA: chemotaxis protein CheX [Clostridiaceae bacterium]
MDINTVNPFIQAVGDIFIQFGIGGTSVVSMEQKDKMYVETDITAIIGITGDVRGNVSYSMSEETAIKIISIMMMGMPVNCVDEMGLSALGEMTNMVTGHAAMLLGKGNVKIDITPPSIVYGKDMHFSTHTNEITMVKLSTDVGEIEVDLGLGDGSSSKIVS